MFECFITCTDKLRLGLYFPQVVMRRERYKKQNQTKANQNEWGFQTNKTNAHKYFSNSESLLTPFSALKWPAVGPNGHKWWRSYYHVSGRYGSGFCIWHTMNCKDIPSKKWQAVPLIEDHRKLGSGQVHAKNENSARVTKKQKHCAQVMAHGDSNRPTHRSDLWNWKEAHLNTGVCPELCVWLAGCWGTSGALSVHARPRVHSNLNHIYECSTCF